MLTNNKCISRIMRVIQFMKKDKGYSKKHQKRIIEILKIIYAKDGKYSKEEIEKAQNDWEELVVKPFNDYLKTL